MNTKYKVHFFGLSHQKKLKKEEENIFFILVFSSFRRSFKDIKKRTGYSNELAINELQKFPVKLIPIRSNIIIPDLIVKTYFMTPKTNCYTKNVFFFDK